MSILLLYSYTMSTWILVLFLVVNSQPVGITNVPGYASADECDSAGREAAKYSAKYFCIPGPTKK